MLVCTPVVRVQGTPCGAHWASQGNGITSCALVVAATGSDIGSRSPCSGRVDASASEVCPYVGPPGR
ncbi:hypothetical protein L210DRAFT_3523283 [Boletus edulis BED1]|uniref:Uncharacterized protein n=1 Tax=Boletus edulis BED1 TaxID=1328754 RepID=A0AAD4C4V2_BOLED|nr:hypothetical protein L210DRAFT_3523283 [Boletus edulis BED1]